MDPIDISDKILSKIECIHSIWQELKASRTLPESKYMFIAGVEGGLINYKELLKTKKIKGNNVLVSNLQTSIIAFQEELKKQAEQENLKKFLNSADKNSNLDFLMRKIEQDVKYINLDVSVDIERKQAKSFDEMNLMINKNNGQISSNTDEENF